MRMHLHRGQEHVDDAAVGVQHNGRRFVVVTVRLAGVDTHGKGTYLVFTESSKGVWKITQFHPRCLPNTKDPIFKTGEV